MEMKTAARATTGFSRGPRGVEAAMRRPLELGALKTRKPPVPSRTAAPHSWLGSCLWWKRLATRLPARPGGGTGDLSCTAHCTHFQPCSVFQRMVSGP
jgi:hypothetical protein